VVQGDVVYLDIVFMINLVMDYVILWTTAKFAHVRSSAARLFAGAVIGALASLLLFYLLYMVPGVVVSTFKLFLLKMLISLVMAATAFPFRDMRKFFGVILNLYLVAFAMGGAMIGSIYLFQNNPAAYSTMNGLIVFLVNVHFSWLAAAIAVAILLARWGRNFVRKNLLRAMLQVPVVVRFGDKRLALKALVDTGNSLKDPLTQKPVMIAEYGALKELLPESFKVAFEKGPENLEEMIKGLQTDVNWGFRVRMIPFSSIGQQKGMLLGLRPDDLVIVTDDSYIKVRDVVVAVYRHRLSSKGEYRALLHPDLLDAA